MANNHRSNPPLDQIHFVQARPALDDGLLPAVKEGEDVGGWLGCPAEQRGLLRGRRFRFAGRFLAGSCVLVLGFEMD